MTLSPTYEVAYGVVFLKTALQVKLSCAKRAQRRKRFQTGDHVPYRIRQSLFSKRPQLINLEIS
jgi:hypothetical protein